MNNEVFRFVVARPPKSSNVSASNIPSTISLSIEDASFKSEVKAAGLVDVPKNKIYENAVQYLAGPNFLSNLLQLPIPLLTFMQWMDSKTTTSFEEINAKTPEIFGMNLGNLVKQASFKTAKNKLALSLMAASIIAEDKQISRFQLLKAYRAIALLEFLGQPNVSGTSIKKLMNRPVVFPKEIYPVNFDDPKRAKWLEDNKKAQKEKIEKIENELRSLNNSFLNYSKAVDEILRVYDKHLDESREADKGTNISANRTGRLANLDLKDKLSNETKAVLIQEKIEVSSMKPGQTINRLTDKRKEFHKNIQILTTDLLNIKADLTDLSFSGVGDSQCYPVTTAKPEPGISYIPQTRGKVHGLLVGELLKVRQERVRYELGDIAHVENIMQGESKSKKLRQFQKSEEITLNEAETNNETEKDLQTQDQFELQTEANKTINIDKSADAGVSLSASYGPVEMTASANGSISLSSQESKRTATNYAREVVSRSAQKIKERVYLQRKRTTIDEFELINEHTVNNSQGVGHIAGIYRWVNKINKVQIVNYGLRHLLEFIVPEPAAFYRFAFEERPDAAYGMKKPVEPSVCRNGKTKLLKPYDITESNYLEWFGQYGLVEITPPPPMIRIVTFGKTEEKKDVRIGEGTEPIIQSVDVINIPENYKAKTATIKIHGRFDGAWKFDFIIGSVNKAIRDSDSKAMVDIILDNETGELPLSIFARNVYTLGVTVEVECIREPNAYTEWQINAFNALLTAYHEQKSLFEREQAAREFRSEAANIKGKNPLLNQEIIKDELKKQALSQLTGQQYDFFDSMLKKQLEFGYPEISFNDAYEEGKYIRFFENAFEWHNMTYVFYPYFWGNKGEWIQSFKIEDNSDPLFEKFLKAGSVRIHVPVRPGFEEVMLSYLQQGGSPWDGSEGPFVEGEGNGIYISMLEEIKSQMEADFETAPGSVSIDTGSNSLTGFNTRFSSTDIDREIILNSQSCRIAYVESETALTLREPYTGGKLTRIGYYFGVRFVGEPWEELIPTNLIKLANDNPGI